MASGRRSTTDTGPVSVVPYTWPTGTPRACRVCRYASGTVEEPAITPRKQASDVSAQRGCSNTARSVAGTISESVGWLSCISASQALGSKRGCSTTSTPASSAGRVWMHSPPTWNSGKVESTRSPATKPCAQWLARALASKPAWVCSAPLGRPVVPEV